MSVESKKELNDLKIKFNQVIKTARKIKANLITSDTELEKLSSENLVLMGQVTKLNKDILNLKEEISIHSSSAKKVIKIMKDPSQDRDQVAIRVANILCPICQ